MSERKPIGFTMKAAVLGIVAVVAMLVFGSWWMGQSAQEATEKAVRAVSMFYLDELTGRRQQVVEKNLADNIEKAQTAIGLMTAEDLSDSAHLQTYQSKMKALFNLEKFAFVDETGLIYTSLGMQEDIDDYAFDYRTLSGPDISVKGLDGDEKNVIIAVPTDGIPFQGRTLVACFMEIDMKEMVEGLSLSSDANATTFCNIYTHDGIALTDMVLGGLASEDNLLDALATAQFEEGYSYGKVVSDFEEGNSGVASFTYGGVQETLDYVPIAETDWMLSYLIRESVITEQVGGISDELTRRSLVQTLLTAFVMLAVGGLLLSQTRRSARLALEKEALETESRVKQQEMERQIALQERLLDQEKQRAQQASMITALASDYRSVYYVDLDTDEGVCYQANERIEEGMETGERFTFSERFENYAHRFVDEQYRQSFLDFVQPSAIRNALATNAIVSYRYLVKHGNVESYEALRMAGVRHPKDRDDGIVHAIGVGFADVDVETRDQMAQSQALADALVVAEDASKAKTAFLSSMSHEIRTPMNAIIGLDSLALADEGVPDKTRDKLEKIGDSAHHLLELINDVLDVSRIESGRMVIRNEAFSFSRMLEQVNTIISGQCAEKGLEYHCKVKGRVAEAYIGDDVKLRQTLINLLGNAVKFTPSGGRVDLSVERTAHFDGHTTLRFTVSDTGIGIAEEFLPRIFDTFAQEDSSSTSKYGSTGLGLAITKNIVELMNGSIEVESTKGEGTTFTVTLTLADAETVADGSVNEKVNPHELDVLVIDDDPVACDHAKLVLESVGVTTTVASSGPQAVDMVRLRHARCEPFDLILVDWKMPDMDGVETTRQIRSIAGSESAIIILTAYNWDDVLEEAVSAGVDSFLAKPLFATSVLDEFQTAFKKKNAEGGRAARKADLAGCRVLLAEDMPINAEIMVEVLKMRGIEAEHAENGRIAVDMFEAHDPGYYDAVLMDMRMPEMDGLTATATIRAMDRPDALTTPIIALTANAFDEDVQQSLQAGLNAHLSKPVEPDTLFETLESLIGNGRSLC